MSEISKDPLCLDHQLCFPLYACAKEVVRQYRKPLSPLGLTYTQYIVMMVLWEDGSTTERELGRRVSLDSGTLAPLLKRLERQGLIHRERPSADERTLRVSLTEAGAALRHQAQSVPDAMRECIPLPEDELFHLRDLLKRALSGMNARNQEE